MNAIWKGLGYYSRAARLLSGSQKVVKEYDGRLPEDPKEMEKEVPGIGRYSSGAIASIAYGVRVPVVSRHDLLQCAAHPLSQLDGNVHRLLSRLLALHASAKSKATLDILWQAAEAFIDDNGLEFPGDVNQALIELGSTVCRVKNPLCDSCPLRSGCFAYQETQVLLFNSCNHVKAHHPRVKQRNLLLRISKTYALRALRMSWLPYLASFDIP